ncbi:M15 family metallopeptidase [Haloechinothrix halophila]|uniref:M15 family metallopeptidase n=1 Tax=Haloechinothrix halophila TaxID=1069073 RepID=UPI000403292B|nr:M15 family metallopeptidase [Haloechinothrix halophila]
MTAGSSHGRFGARVMAALAVITASTAVLTGCGPQATAPSATGVAIADARGADQQVAPAAAEFIAPSSDDWAAARSRLTGELVSADLLVIGTAPLRPRLRERIRAMDQVRAAIPVGLASVRVADRSITVAAVDAARYRRFTPPTTATTDGVWRAVAAGDIILDHEIAAGLDQPLGGTLTVRRNEAELPLRIGAHATTIPRVHAVMNEERGEQLGVMPDNALVIALRGDIAAGSAAVRDIARHRATVTVLRPPTEATVSHTAALTGGAVAQAVGTFSYRYFPDGSVQPEPEWVNANIRTESVPILGTVTCHRVMLPQLRAALSEVVRRGLTAAIDPGDYGGCYVPRFIGHDPNRGLSLHTWGIAFDLNVAGNHRGTKGEIDRDVVAIFKKWGFAWGGDWDWTDPMHFELAALVRT